jgi:pyrroloquinoline-quinone synthase
LGLSRELLLEVFFAGTELMAPKSNQPGETIMQPEETLKQLDQLIQSRSILCHPFYVAWQRGELTGGQLATYAAVYYPHVAAFPHYLEAAIKAADDPQVIAELERNLADELGVPAPHNELWLDFAAGLGLARESVASAAVHPAARRMVVTFLNLSKRSIASGLAALYAYESQQPEVSRQKADGLRSFYGIDEPDALAYFEVHAEADLEHRAGERRVLAHCLEAGASGDEIIQAAGQALDAYWGLLDGVCAEAGISN